MIDTTQPPKFSEPTGAGDGKPVKEKLWPKVKKVLNEYGLTPLDENGKPHVRFWSIIALGIGIAVKSDVMIGISTTGFLTGEYSAYKRGEGAVNALLSKTKGMR